MSRRRGGAARPARRVGGRRWQCRGRREAAWTDRAASRLRWRPHRARWERAWTNSRTRADRWRTRGSPPPPVPAERPWAAARRRAPGTESAARATPTACWACPADSLTASPPHSRPTRAAPAPWAGKLPESKYSCRYGRSQ
eukprot:scaffold28132_cov103-Isochrysis_galbana.AAC.3